MKIRQRSKVLEGGQVKEKLIWRPKNWLKNIGLIFGEGLKAVVFVTNGNRRFQAKTVNATLKAALNGHGKSSDISDHLGIIFFFATLRTNQLMVELGTRGGESTRALLAAAEVSDCPLLSVDIDDCSGIDLPFSERWNFVQESDVEFGGKGFEAWCAERDKEAQIDVLFIDTSHEYEHTKQELEIWCPYVVSGGIIILHDTNMGNGIYAKLDGSLGSGWNNHRGVIRAVEEYVGGSYDEKSLFSDRLDQYSILHVPYSNGLTVLKKHK